MKRACLTLALGVSLTGCGHFSLPIAAKPLVAAPAPPACPGALRADLLPQPPVPDNAGFPAATTDAESAQVSSYLAWLADLARWGRQGWARAGDAKVYCDGAAR